MVHVERIMIIILLAAICGTLLTTFALFEFDPIIAVLAGPFGGSFLAISIAAVRAYRGNNTKAVSKAPLVKKNQRENA